MPAANSLKKLYDFHPVFGSPVLHLASPAHPRRAWCNEQYLLRYTAGCVSDCLDLEQFCPICAALERLR